MNRKPVVAALMPLLLLAEPIAAQSFPGANLGPANVWVTLGVGPWGYSGLDWHGSTWLARGPLVVGARVAGGSKTGSNQKLIATSALAGFRPILNGKTVVIAVGVATPNRRGTSSTCSGCVVDESAFLREFAPSFATEFSLDVGSVGFGAAVGAVGGPDSFASLTLLLKLGASRPRAEARRSR